MTMKGEPIMLGKIKKVFFTGVFGIMYVSFAAQLIYILGWGGETHMKMLELGLLSVEWLVLIAARYLSKKSSSGSQHSGGYHNNYRR
jgi:hypothetical protein